MKHSIFLFSIIAFIFSSCSKSDPIVKPDPDPVVIINFSLEKHHLHLNENLKIMNNTTGSKFQWVFSDGTTSEEKTPLKSFNTPGKYKVTLKIGNIEKSTNIEVMNGESSFILESRTTTSLHNVWYNINGGDFIVIDDLLGGTKLDTIYTNVGELNVGWVANDRRYTIEQSVNLEAGKTGLYIVSPSSSFTSIPIN